MHLQRAILSRSPLAILRTFFPSPMCGEGEGRQVHGCSRFVPEEKTCGVICMKAGHPRALTGGISGSRADASPDLAGSCSDGHLGERKSGTGAEGGGDELIKENKSP